MRRLRLPVYTMRDIDERGMRAVMEEGLKAATRGAAGFCLSLDRFRLPEITKS